MSDLRQSPKVSSGASPSLGSQVTNSITIEGRGLHTGKLTKLTITPAKAAHQGVVFRMKRDGVDYSSPAFWLRVSGTSRATALILRGESRRRFELFTVEHFLAAALVGGHHDLDVEIETPEGPLDAMELPCLDGSALAWFRALSRLKTDAAAARERVCWKVIRSVEVVDGFKKVVFSPLLGAREEALTRYHCSVDFGARLKQSAFFEINWRDPAPAQRVFEGEIAPARTFGFKAELEALEKRGLARGASLENAILLDGDAVVNEGGFKVANELAAHKLMDAVGDLFLMGSPFLGRIDLHAAGHSMHLRAIEEAFRTGALVKGMLPASGPFIRD